MSSATVSIRSFGLFSSRYFLQNASVTCVRAGAMIQNVIHLEMGPFIREGDSLTSRFIKPSERAAVDSFVPTASVQRSAVQIDGAMSHLTGRLPPGCTQSHAPVGPSCPARLSMSPKQTTG